MKFLQTRMFPYLLSCLSGVLLLLAMPGSGSFWPLLFIGILPLLFAIEKANFRQTVVCAVLAGLVHYIGQLYWLVNVLQQYGGIPVIIAAGALVLLALYMSCYLVLFCLGAGVLLKEDRPKVLLWFLPVLWVALDWLRSWLFSGFPWMDLGYGLASVPQIVQFADITGHYGVTFLIVLCNVLLFQYLCRFVGGAKQELLGQRECILKYVAIPLSLLALVSGYSVFRWYDVSGQLKSGTVKTAVVGIVQGNIDQSLKWSPGLQLETVEKYLQLTSTIFQDIKPDIVVWPETALPFYPTESQHISLLQNTVSQYDFALITGAPWYQVVDMSKKQINYYNSAQLLLPTGRFGGSYYKSHLVPFGEYVPLRKFLPFLEPLVESVGDFSAGTVGNPMQWKNVKAGVVICFESIFPDIGRRWVDQGANLLVNLTNDAWYGRSTAPYHSLAMTRFRAIETRRNVVRAANTGFSGVIDPLGRLVIRSPLFESWATVQKVVLLENQTVFVRIGYLFAPCCFFMVVSQLLYRRFRKMRSTVV